MELIPFLIFAVIAFNIFRRFTKAASKSQGGSAKEMMRRLHEQNQNPNASRYQDKSPTQRERQSLQSKGQSSPWGENGGASPGAQVATNYLQQKAKAARKAAQKNPEQTGRRGRNIDQNRNRTHEWGQRGDGGLFLGKTAIILLVIGAGVLYALSQLPPN